MDERSLKKLLDSPPEVVKKAVKRLAVSASRLRRQSRTFTFRGREYDYFAHAYNLAWRNERAVEIPIALEYLRAHPCQSVLEVGNVLSHYVKADHDIVDKYEVTRGVINEDVVDYSPPKKYDLIISVSTLEHVGYDETPPDNQKAARAVAHLVDLLSPGGEMVATVPLGLSSNFDRLLESGEIAFTESYAMKRKKGNTWVQSDIGSVRGATYARYSFRASALIVGVIRRGQAEMEHG